MRSVMFIVNIMSQTILRIEVRYVICNHFKKDLELHRGTPQLKFHTNCFHTTRVTIFLGDHISSLNYTPTIHKEQGGAR